LRAAGAATKKDEKDAMLGPPALPRTLDASIRDLDSKRPEVRASAIEDLVRHARRDDAVRTRALPLLDARLRDDDARVRGAAAVGLGDLVAKERVDALLSAVDDEDAHVRQMAMNALGEIGDPRAAVRLKKALRDRRPEVRYQAVIAYSRVTEDSADIEQMLLDASNDDDDAIVHIALRVAEERYDRGAEPDERILARARAIVKSGSPHVVLAAAILLAKAGDESARPSILRVVRGERIAGQEPEKEDEQAAVELAGELGLREAIPELERRVWGIGRFVRDTCRFHARIALARMDHARAVAEIMKDLESARPDVIGEAVVAAGRARLAQARTLVSRQTAAAVDPELVKEALRRIDEGRS
jgi:HEAT repeat protein